MAILTVTKENGDVIPLPAPKSLTWGIQDIDGESAGRNQQGDMFRDRVAIKRKISCEWGPLNSQDMSILLNAVEDQFFSLTAPDAKDGKDRTMTAYVGDRSAPAYILHEGKWLWLSLTMDFVER